MDKKDLRILKFGILTLIGLITAMYFFMVKYYTVGLIFITIVMGLCLQEWYYTRKGL